MKKTLWYFTMVLCLPIIPLSFIAGCAWLCIYFGWDCAMKGDE